MANERGRAGPSKLAERLLSRAQGPLGGCSGSLERSGNGLPETSGPGAIREDFEQCLARGRMRRWV